MGQLITVSGKTLNASSGFNLYIDTTTACDAACPFCIAPIVDRKDGKGFFEGLSFALSLTRQVDGTIQIVGGEPLISKRIYRLLHEVSTIDCRRTIVNTNASSLSPNIASAMKSAGVSCVNVSRHHYDEACNQDIMRMKKVSSNNDFHRGISYLHDVRLGVRMQCNIIKGHIDSVESMLAYINWCLSLECREISFSQLFPLSLFDYQKPIEPGYAEAHQVDLRKLVTEMDASGVFSPVPAHELRGKRFLTWGEGSSGWGSSNWGGGKRRFWYGPGRTYLSLKTLSGYDEQGLPNPTTYDKSSDDELREGVLAFAVLHTDGTVSASWDKRERILFSPQEVVERNVVRKHKTFSMIVA